MKSEHVLPTLGSCIMCDSRRGGYLLYKRHGDITVNRKAVKCVAYFGGEINWLLDSIVFVGPGKSLTYRPLDGITELTPVPLFLSFLLHMVQP